MSIEFFRRPENLKKIQVIDKNFENKKIQKKIKKFLEKRDIQWDGGDLSDFIKIVQENNISKFSAIRELLKIYKKNNFEISEEEISLPLNYISIMVLEYQDLNEDFDKKNLYKKYQDFYNSLSIEDRKFFAGKNEISILRQSPNAKKQSIVEAVANGIDAMSDQKIGEKGLGIKQALAFILDGGEIEVISKKRGGEMYYLKIEKNLDDGFRENIQKIEIENFNESGTELVIRPKEKISEEEKEEFLNTVKEKFGLIFGVNIYLNGELINDNLVYDENLIQLNQEESEKKIEVEIDEFKILIRDNGSGMDEEVLSRMFLERLGEKKMEKVEKEKVDLYFLDNNKNDNLKINIARKQEVLENIILKHQDEFVNLLEKDVLINSNFLRVPEARQSIFVDNNFFKTIDDAVNKVFDGGIEDLKKIQFANLMILFLNDFLEIKTGSSDPDNVDMVEFIKKIKENIRDKIFDLNLNWANIFPNDKFFQDFLKVQNDLENNENNNNSNEKIFLNTELYNFNPENIEGIKKSEYFDSDNIFQVKTDKDFEVVKFKDKFYINQDIIDRYESLDKKEEEIKKMIEELLELAVNPVQTSYDGFQERENKFIVDGGLDENFWEYLENKSESIEEIKERKLKNNLEIVAPSKLREIGDLSYIIKKIPKYVKNKEGVEFSMEDMRINRIEKTPFGYKLFTLWKKSGSSEKADKIFILDNQGNNIDVINDSTIWNDEFLWYSYNKDISFIFSEDYIYVFDSYGKKMGVEIRFVNWGDIKSVVETDNGCEVYISDGFEEKFLVFEKDSNNRMVFSHFETISDKISRENDPWKKIMNISDYNTFDGWMYEGRYMQNYFNQDGFEVFYNKSDQEQTEVVDIILKIGDFVKNIKLFGDFKLLGVKNDLLVLLSGSKIITYDKIGLKNELDYIMDLYEDFNISELPNVVLGKKYIIFDTGLNKILLDYNLNLIGIFGSSVNLIDDKLVSIDEYSLKEYEIYLEDEQKKKREKIKEYGYLEYFQGLEDIIEKELKGDENKNWVLKKIKDEYLYELLYTDEYELSELTKKDGFFYYSLEQVEELFQKIIYYTRKYNLDIRETIVDNMGYLKYFNNENMYQKKGELREEYLEYSVLVSLDSYIEDEKVIDYLFERIKKIEIKNKKEKIGLYNLLSEYMDYVDREDGVNEEIVDIFFQKIEGLKKVNLYYDLIDKIYLIYDLKNNKKSREEQEQEVLKNEIKMYKEYFRNKIILDFKTKEEFIPLESENIFDVESFETAELYYWGKKGRVKDEDIKEKISQEIPEKIKIHLEEQIKKEILGQGSERNVYVRELLQNMIDASKKQAKINIENGFKTKKQRRIDVSVYQEIDGDRSFFVDKYRDYGSGIPSLVNLLVAQINEKSGKGDESGFFGSGFLSIFEDADKVEIKTSTDGKIKYIDIDIQRDQEGDVLGFQVKRYKIGENKEKFQGTEITRKVEMVDGKIPELEFLLLQDSFKKNTISLDSRLDNGKKIKIYLNGERQEKKTIVEEFGKIKIDGEKYWVKIESGHISQVLSGDGLRMGNLEEKYLDLVPKQVLKLVHDKKISLILDKKIPLIKDRSMIAGEDKFLPEINKFVGVSMIKIAVKDFLANKIKFKGFPDDYFRNERYTESYEDFDGQRIKELARKINLNKKIDTDDLIFISEGDDGDLKSNFARLAVLVEVDYITDSGNVIKISPYDLRIQKLFEYAEKTNDQSLKDKIYQSSGGILDMAKMELISEKMKSFVDMKNVENGIKQGREKKKEVNIDDLTEKEKEVLDLFKEFLNDLGIRLKVIESEYSGGFYDGFLNVLSINRLKLNKESIKELTETVVHELGHYYEGSDGKHVGKFTHQVDGSFGDGYKKAVKFLLGKIKNYSS